ncbi:MAG: hypothetical protein OSJ36_10260, partial [Odoribacter sp.]|nr:hypothetical protein [Odoribacter sp.]
VTVYSACSGLSTVIDEQGKEYSIKEMADNRCWMTQNLRRTDVSHRHANNGAGADTDGTNLYTHEGEQGNDKAYGVYYVWNVAMQGSTAEKAKGICPIGWYVPTDLEWRQLEMAYGMTSAQANGNNAWRGYNEGTKLKAGGNSGFNATLSGYNGTSYFGVRGYYWSSTQSGSYAYYRYFQNNYATINRYILDKNTYASLRCIKATCYDAKPVISTAGSISGGSTAVNYAIKIKSTGAAAVSCGGLVYSWYVDGSLLANQRAATLTWTPKYAGTYEIVRRASVDTDPMTYKETKTTVIAYSPCMGRTVVYDDQGNNYNIKEMADNRCWMIQNIRRRDVNHRHANNGAAVDNDGTNKHLHDGVQANDVNHGIHYIWSVAMGGSASEKAQGLCPPGWYIPTDAEWKTLEMAYGMTSGQANGNNAWRGYNQGTRLKANGNSGFNATLSGYNGTSYFGVRGYYWSSTQSGSYAYYRYFQNNYATINRYILDKNTYASLRCIKATCYGVKPTISSAGSISGGYIGVNYAITIKNTGKPVVSCGGLIYSWYIDGVLVANQRAAALTWTPIKVGTYEIVRRVTMDDDPTNYKEAKTTVTAYSPCAGKTYVDDEQGNRYSIKEMADDRCWMTQNLRRTDVSHRHAGNGAAADTDGTNLYTHEGAQGNDKTHGVHYTWSVAMGGSTAEKVKGLCPPGWYIPTDAEWKTLEMAYGMTSAQANGNNAWRGYNEGTKLKPGGASGFNATLSGYNGSSYLGVRGYYWSSTQSGSYAYYRYFQNNYATINRYILDKNTYASLRCIRTMCYAGTTSAITSAGSITGGKVGVNYPFKIKNSGAATVNCGGVEYSWYVDGKLVSGQVAASLTYTFTKAGGYTIKRRATADNGTYSEALATVTVVTPCQGASTVTDEQGNVYTIKEMADTRCWMTQNMRRTNVVHMHAGNSAAAAADGKSTHEGVQTNDRNHGVHYRWSVAMGGSTAEKAKGICPVGWHVPTDLEWRQLEMAYGMTSGQANGNNAWRGYNQGTRLKSGGNSGFNATLSGYNGSSYFGVRGYYWSSTQSGSYAYYRYFQNTYATINRYILDKNTYASLRCIKNE